MADVNKPKENLEELLLNKPLDRYKLIIQASNEVKELKKKEEFKYVEHYKLLEAALKNVLNENKSEQKSTTK